MSSTRQLYQRLTFLTCFMFSVAATRIHAGTSTHMNTLTNANAFTIVAFGDSTTATRGNLMVYAQVLQDHLLMKSGNVQVINAGKGGNTTVNAKARFEKDVIACSPSLVIIAFGINDSAIDVCKNPPASQPRVAQAVYVNNLHYFVQTLKTNQAQVILMTPNALRWTPNMKSLYGKPPYNPNDPDGFNLLLRAYAESVRKIAREEGVPLVDVFSAFEQYGKQPGQAMEDLLLDGMHPNEKGQRLVADLLIKAIMVANPAIQFKPVR